MSHGGVLFCGGGTGGHVYPGLAVAALLRDQPRSWIGDPERIEARLVPAAGIPLFPWGLRRPRITDPRWIGHALVTVWRCWRHMQRHRPRVVVAMGGYAALIPGLLAPLMGRPLLVLESNAHPGRTNRLLARMATLVATQFAQAHARLLARRCVRLGNPIRAIAVQPRGTHAHLRVLVCGGSLAAKDLNDLVALAASALHAHGGIHIVHLAGEQDQARIAAMYQAAGCAAEVLSYCDDMPALYARIDVAVTRAGATTVAELCAAGIPALYVPLPWAAEDHQSANAQAMAEAGAATVLSQRTATAQDVAQWLCTMADERQRVIAMSQAARRMAMPASAAACARAVRLMLRGRS